MYTVHTYAVCEIIGRHIANDNVKPFPKLTPPGTILGDHLCSQPPGRRRMHCLRHVMTQQKEEWVWSSFDLWGVLALLWSPPLSAVRIGQKMHVTVRIRQHCPPKEDALTATEWRDARGLSTSRITPRCSVSDVDTSIGMSNDRIEPSQSQKFWFWKWLRLSPLNVCFCMYTVCV